MPARIEQVLINLVSNANLPEELERIIDKCLAKKPEDRYQSVFELNSALNALA